MKFCAFGLEIFIDELFLEETSAERQQIVFLTTLVNVDVHKLPENLPKVHTSEILKSQLMLLYQSRGGELLDTNFHVLRPFEAERISGGEIGEDFEVLPCMPVDKSTSFMLAFRKVQSLKITHLYAGFATDLGSIMLETKFAIWLKASGDSIEKLYVLDLPSYHCVDCEEEQAFEDIQQQFNNENIVKVLMQVPLFGCEVFIAKLASRYRGKIVIDGLLCNIYARSTKSKMQYFIKDFEEAAIVVSMDDLKMAPDCDLDLTVKKFRVHWLPLPDSYKLKLLPRVVDAKTIEIINHNNFVQRSSINMTIYLDLNDEKYCESIPNENADLINLPHCHCAQMKNKLEIPKNAKHASLQDCMQHLVSFYTNKYQQTQLAPNVEDEFEKMFNSPTLDDRSIETVTKIEESNNEKEAYCSRKVVDRPTTSTSKQKGAEKSQGVFVALTDAQKDAEKNTTSTSTKGNDKKSSEKPAALTCTQEIIAKSSGKPATTTSTQENVEKSSEKPAASTSVQKESEKSPSLAETLAMSRDSVQNLAYRQKRTARFCYEDSSSSSE